MQKGFAPILILVGILVIIGVAGGAYYFGKSQVSKSQLPNPVVASQTPQPTTAPQPSSASDETANWKTYTNDYWKFQFQYPPTWALLPGYKPTDISFDIINFDYEANRPQTQAESLSRPPVQVPPEFRIAMYIYKNYTKSEQLIKEFEQSKEKFSVSNIKQIQINSHPAIEYDLTSSTTNKPMVDTVIESNNGYIIRFRYWKEANNTQDTSNYYQILSTFKFTQ